MTRWLVDASNVIGSEPDGWWRDREGAAARLIDALREFAEPDDDVVVVLDFGPAPWAGRDGSVEVAIAPRRGRNAADDDPASVHLVTSDAELAARARASGASVVGAGEFRRRLGY